MGNLYFHEFVPGFNLWYVAAPVLLVIVFAIAHHSIHFGLYDRRGVRKCRIFRGHGTHAWMIASAIIGVIMGVWVMIESGDGIIQYLDNGMAGNESPANSVIGLGIVGTGITIGYGLLVFCVAEFATRLKRNSIRHRYEENYQIIDHNLPRETRQPQSSHPEATPMNSGARIIQLHPQN